MFSFAVLQLLMRQHIYQPFCLTLQILPIHILCAFLFCFFFPICSSYFHIQSLYNAISCQFQTLQVFFPKLHPSVALTTECFVDQKSFIMKQLKLSNLMDCALGNFHQSILNTRSQRHSLFFLIGFSILPFIQVFNHCRICLCFIWFEVGIRLYFVHIISQFSEHHHLSLPH